ncbi:MAG: hypothetical protein K8R85_14200 [Bacteroidetes bacterium]|nr:hypothetical protein [Bacteroidota bacterium]
MKKLIAISFVFVFLYANTEMHQLLKLPVLVHHYLEHCKEANNSSFVGFLYNHYNSEKPHSDNDHHDHQNLPFKTDCANIHTSFAFTGHHQYSFQSTPPVSVKVNVVYNEIIYSSASLSNIWQPPKFS